MRIKSLHPSQGWRAVYPNLGHPRIAPVAFFATIEECGVAGSVRVVPLVVDDHDFGRELVPASDLGHYALLGPDDQVEPEWLAELAHRVEREGSYAARLEEQQRANLRVENQGSR